MALLPAASESKLRAMISAPLAIKRFAVDSGLLLSLSLLTVVAAGPAPPQQPSPGISPQEVAAGRVVVRLRNSPLTARFRFEQFTPDLAAEIAARLSGTAARPLFPLDDGTALHRLRLPSILPGALPVETEATIRARRRRYRLDRWIILELAEGETVMQALERLGKHPLVEVAEPDYRGRGAGVRTAHAPVPGFTPNDPLFAQQWYLDNANDADIDMPEAWEIKRSALSVLIAVLDTGADLDHPDLAAALLPGVDYVNDDSDPSDDEGHGSNVTGLLGAIGGNGKGIAGVAFETFIIPIKVLDDNQFGYYTWWESGFYRAANLGVRVINLSAGGENYSEALHAAVRYASDRGAVICTSMMNFDNDVPYYPAAFSETIAVGATNDEDRRADPFLWGGGSSYGDHIDLVAPGNGLISTNRNGGYARYAGTSQATALVSGVAALMIQLDVTLTVEEVRTILRKKADDQVGRISEDTPGFDIYHGGGRLNAASALDSVATATSVPTAFTATPPRPNPSMGPVPVRFVYDLTEANPVTQRIYDARGRLVITVLEGDWRLAGRHVETWDGKGPRGNLVPSGIYLYELIAGSHRVTGKLIRLK